MCKGVEGAGEFLKRKSLTGADLVHAMSYDLIPSVRIGISGQQQDSAILIAILCETRYDQ